MRLYIDRFDIFLRCACGHKAALTAKEPPSCTGTRYRCSKCGAKDVQPDVWPIWARATKGQPKDRL